MDDRWIWWRLAWRNLWRNKRRTLITASALAFGYLAAVTMIGIWRGMLSEMIETGTNLVTGQLQIHAPDYYPERSMYTTLGGRDGVDVDELVRLARETPGVVAASPRVYGGGLVSSGSETVAGLFVGVDPDQEVEVTRLLQTPAEGRAPRAGEREILIGRDMADLLKVGPGAEVVLVAPASDGSLGNDLYRVSGVFETGMAGLDRAFGILPIGSLQDLMAMPANRIHEVAAAVEDPFGAPAVGDSLAAVLAARGLDYPVQPRPWTVFRAELAEYASLAGAVNGIIVGIIFIMAVFGVANTMLLGTFERRREFAVVRALGTQPGSVARTVVYEGLILGIVALAAGALLSVPVLYWLHNYPPDLSNMFGDFTMSGTVVRPVLRAEYSVDGPVVSAVALLITSILSALYPAYRAVKILPADALADT
jgi:ABC-type lipoprotein release transport system permease subunit